MTLRGVVFDLDGTLVDSGLDFDLIRSEMGLGKGPILEALERMPADRRRACEEILERHEAAGAERATLLAGAREWIDRLDAAAVPRALFTRNARRVVERTLERCQLSFATVIAREDAPAKPDPTAIHHCCRSWNVPPETVWMIGDYVYDLEAGKRAAVKTALVTHGRVWSFASQADFLWHDLVEGLAQLDQVLVKTSE